MALKKIEGKREEGKLEVVLRKFEGKCEENKIEGKSKRKEKVKKNKKLI